MNFLDNNIDEFSSEDEIEKALDEIVLPIGKLARDQDNQTAVVNVDNVKKVVYVYKVMKYLTKSTKAKVQCDIQKPFKSMGSVTVIGKDVTFTNTEMFVKAASLASNVDIFARTDNTIEIDFTFHGLTIN